MAPPHPAGGTQRASQSGHLARLHYTILYHTILILYYTILYCSTLYDTILYYTIASLWGNSQTQKPPAEEPAFFAHGAGACRSAGTTTMMYSVSMLHHRTRFNAWYVRKLNESGLGPVGRPSPDASAALRLYVQQLSPSLIACPPEDSES